MKKNLTTFYRYLFVCFCFLAVGAGDLTGTPAFSQPVDPIASAITQIQAATADKQKQLDVVTGQLAIANAQLAQLQLQYKDASTSLKAASAQVNLLSATLVSVGAYQPGTNITNLLAAANGNVYLPSGTFYFDPSPTFKNNDVRVIGVPRKTTIVLKTAPGATSAMIMYGQRWSWIGIDFVGPAGFIRSYGWVEVIPGANGTIGGQLIRHTPDTVYYDCTFAGNLAGMNHDAYSDNQTYLKCDFGSPGNPIQADAIFNTSNNTAILRCRFFGSAGEHDYRADVNITKEKPANTVTAYNEFWNNNTQKKECLTEREADGSVHVADKYHGWNSHGQSDQANPIMHVSDVYYRGCTWDTLRPGGALVQFDHDILAGFVGNFMVASKNDPGVTTNPRDRVFKKDNVLLNVPMVYHQVFTADPGIVWQDFGNGDILTPTTQPTTQP